jgi:tetratricopeptide (TPR) repeat protein
MWAEARKDLIAYTTKLPNDRRAWEYLAIANLQLGDDAGYRTTCERTVAQFGRMNTAADRNAVARVLALADVPGRNWDAEMERMDIPIRQSPKYQPYLNTRGVLLFRASKYEDALNQLDESRKAYTGSLGLPPGGNKVDGSATDQLFLAMTYYKSNQPDKAAEWLKKATTWLDAVKALKPNPVTVWQIAEWEYHRDEAIKMIKFKD